MQALSQQPVGRSNAPLCMALVGLCPVHTPAVCQAMDAVGTEQRASVLQKGDIRIVCNFPGVL